MVLLPPMSPGMERGPRGRKNPPGKNNFFTHYQMNVWNVLNTHNSLLISVTYMNSHITEYISDQLVAAEKFLYWTPMWKMTPMDAFTKAKNILYQSFHGHSLNVIATWNGMEKEFARISEKMTAFGERYGIIKYREYDFF